MQKELKKGERKPRDANRRVSLQTKEDMTSDSRYPRHRLKHTCLGEPSGTVADIYEHKYKFQHHLHHFPASSIIFQYHPLASAATLASAGRRAAGRQAHSTTPGSLLPGMRLRLAAPPHCRERAPRSFG